MDFRRFTCDCFDIHFEMRLYNVLRKYIKGRVKKDNFTLSRVGGSVKVIFHFHFLEMFLELNSLEINFRHQNFFMHQSIGGITNAEFEEIDFLAKVQIFFIFVNFYQYFGFSILKIHFFHRYKKWSNISLSYFSSFRMSKPFLTPICEYYVVKITLIIF